MNNSIYNKYRNLSDKDIVAAAVLNEPPEDSAVAYLLQERYQPLLCKLSIEVYNSLEWHDDCVNELFVYLKGKEQRWLKLAAIEWRGTFGSWLSRTAKNYFLYLKPSMIGKLQNVISIDNEDALSGKPVVPELGMEDYESRERKVILMEAISLLPDADLKFIVLKKLQGYSSKEVAVLLRKRWEKHGTVKLSNKKEVVVPSAAYVDVRLQRARLILKELMNKIK